MKRKGEDILRWVRAIPGMLLSKWVVVSTHSLVSFIKGGKGSGVRDGETHV